MTLEGRAEAKINLGLRILERRPDGYHSIRSVFHTVSLHDSVAVTCTPGSRRITIDVSGLDIPGEPSENLACRAAEEFLAESGLKRDVHISIEKRIPVAAGLGGGSSDAACVLRLLRRATGVDPGLEKVALRVGSDVPFLLGGGAALVEGRGELIRRMASGDFWAVILNPGIRVSTAEAYEAWDRRYCGLTARPAGCDDRCPELAWHEGRPFPVSLCNDFLPLLLERHPAAMELLGQLENSCPAWGLSGSGPSFFGLFRSASEAEAFGLSVPRSLSPAVCRATGGVGASSNW